MSRQVELEGLLGDAKALLEVVDETTDKRLSRSVARLVSRWIDERKAE